MTTRIAQCERLIAKRGRTVRTDPEAAAAELAEQVGGDDAALTLCFATPDADFPALSAALRRRVSGPVVACTTAGEISSEHGHERGAIVAASVSSGRLRAHASMILPGEADDPARLRAAADRLLSRRTLGVGDGGCFALLINDGLSMGEERLTAGVSAALGSIPLVGGSAGDDLAFEQTMVSLDGVAIRGGAVLCLIETAHPFKVFHDHHFRATDTRLVITGADPATRRVYEIDGMPAAAGYARAIGVDPADLCPEVYSAHPVMLRVGGKHFVRSIQRANDDGSLTFYCAIDTGLVLRVGEGMNIVECLENQVQRIHDRLPGLELTVGFDCVLRRLELLGRGLRETVHDRLRGVKMVGFSTYGEQFGSVHVNQTITGIALGNAA